jgi:hypothetical protein
MKPQALLPQRRFGAQVLVVTNMKVGEVRFERSK